MLIWLLLVYVSDCARAALSDEEIDDTQAVVQILETRQGTLPTVYITLGRSVATIAAALEVRGHRVFHLPLTGFKYGVDSSFVDLSDESGQGCILIFRSFCPRKAKCSIQESSLSILRARVVVACRITCNSRLLQG